MMMMIVQSLMDTVGCFEHSFCIILGTGTVEGFAIRLFLKKNRSYMGTGRGERRGEG